MNLQIITAALFLVMGNAAVAESKAFGEIDLLSLDKDGDNAISMQEFDVFSDFAFDEIDSDNNNAINRKEFGIHADEDGFSGVDTDNNGLISVDEFKTHMRENFKAADKDGDGKLN